MATVDELRTQLLDLIPQLNEEQLVDLFEQDMLEDGYLSNDRRPDDGLWQTAQEWLKSYLDSWSPSAGMLENILQDMHCTILPIPNNSKGRAEALPLPIRDFPA